MSDYIPSTEADLKGFGSNFASLVGLAPATFGMVAGDAAQIEAAAEDYATKYDLAVNPVTRTKAAIIEKNNAKAVLKTILRGYAMQIKNNRGVTDAAKGNLGLNVDDSEQTPVLPPQTHPIVNVTMAGIRQHHLRFVDETTPQSRAKPAGAVGLQLFCRLSETAPASVLDTDFMAFVTKHALTLNFQEADVGKRAWYYARWQTATGAVGPWSLVASRAIGE